MDTSTNTTAHVSNNQFDERPKELPGTLNVLTILTFIGCALIYLFTLYSLYSNSPAQYEKSRTEITEQLDKIDPDSFAGKMLSNSLEQMEVAHKYHWTIFATSIIFTTLCLIGAIRMRKRRKSGFPIYTIGELAPLVVSAALLGVNAMFWVSAVIAVVFVVLYAGQRKHLIYP